MTKLIIEVRGGCVVQVIATGDEVQYVLADWDIIEDEFNPSFYEPDVVVDEQEFNEILEGYVK